MNQQPQSPNSDEKRKHAVIRGAFIVRALATSVEVFLHRGMGERYLGAQAFAVLLIVIAYGALSGLPGIDWLLVYLGLYVIACGRVRLGIVHGRFRDEVVHSYYTGFPRMWRLPLLRCLRETTIKGAVEPCIVFFLGGFLMPVSEALGSYLMIAAGALLISMVLSQTHERIRMLDMQDALIDQRRRAEVFRQRDWVNRKVKE